MSKWDNMKALAQGATPSCGRPVTTVFASDVLELIAIAEKAEEENLPCEHPNAVYDIGRDCDYCPDCGFYIHKSPKPKTVVEGIWEAINDRSGVFLSPNHPEYRALMALAEAVEGLESARNVFSLGSINSRLNSSFAKTKENILAILNGEKIRDIPGEKA